MVRGVYITGEGIDNEGGRWHNETHDIGADDMGVHQDYAMTEKLTRLIQDNFVGQQEGKLRELCIATDGYRLSKLQEYQWKESVLSYAFWLYVYNNDKLSKQGLIGCLQAEINPVMKDIPRRYNRDIYVLYEQIRFYNRHPVCAFWFCFWHDIWTHNRFMTVIKENTKLFNPRCGSSLCYIVMTRQTLQSVLHSHNLSPPPSASSTSSSLSSPSTSPTPSRNTTATLFKRYMFTNRWLDKLYNKLYSLGLQAPQQSQLLPHCDVMISTVPPPTVVEDSENPSLANNVQDEQNPIMSEEEKHTREDAADNDQGKKQKSIPTVLVVSETVVQVSSWTDSSCGTSSGDEDVTAGLASSTFFGPSLTAYALEGSLYHSCVFPLPTVLSAHCQAALHAAAVDAAAVDAAAVDAAHTN
eukprot:GHVQ01000492.1.p1 GENE.GHVQ01000492.1~~GHVQ01000492.1.p1  ORF type:complete len:412 (-),score=80.19 GHVQ01000492.1:283-1518(-)